MVDPAKAAKIDLVLERSGFNDDQPDEEPASQQVSSNHVLMSCHQQRKTSATQPKVLPTGQRPMEGLTFHCTKATCSRPPLIGRAVTLAGINGAAQF
jgi:hypothetical protein